MYGNFPTTSKPISESSIQDGPVQKQHQTMNGWIAFSRVARLPLLPGLWMPVLWGSALAWWLGSPLDGWSLGFLLLVTTMLALGLNLLTSYQDYRRALKVDLENDPRSVVNGTSGPILDGCRCLLDGWIRPGTVRSLAYIAFVIAVLAIAWLGFLGGWPLWFFGGTSFLLIVLFLASAIRYGNHWWVVDDLGLLFAVGILPALGAFYSQSQSLNRVALIASITPAVLAWLAYQAYSLYSWRRDWKLRKRTAVVVLGLQRALDVATVIGLLAFGATILLVALNELPVWSLLVLGALPTFLRAFARGHHPIILRVEALQAVNLSAVAAVLAGLLAISAFWLAG